MPHYPADNMKRPTGPTCDGCHSVNYDVRTKTVTEWNVGCEKCHGPGSEHAANPARTNIFNPARADFVHANDTCIQCHSQGQPLTNPIEGRYYDWPVGFRVGLNLSDFWHLDKAELGKTDFLYFADGTAHKNRMQGNDFVTSRMYQRGVTCFTLPRRPRHGQQRRPPEAGGDDVPDVPRAWDRRTGRTTRRSSSTRITRRDRRAASASAATCRRSSRRSAT